METVENEHVTEAEVNPSSDVTSFSDAINGNNSKDERINSVKINGKLSEVPSELDNTSSGTENERNNIAEATSNQHLSHVIDEMSLLDGLSFFLSLLYGLMVLLLTIVIKASQFITPDIFTGIVDAYLIMLYMISIIWFCALKIRTMKRFGGSGGKDFIKSFHASNRWLKSVLSVFGLGIIIKEGLETIAYLQIHNPDCKDREIYIAMPIVYSVFIILQVSFIFMYSKVHLQEFRHFSRFGIIHIIATNLSVWMGVISDETAHAILVEQNQDMVAEGGPEESATEAAIHRLKEESSGSNSFNREAFNSFVHQLHESCNASYDIVKDYITSSNLDTEAYGMEDSKEAHGHDIGNCTCDSEFCQVIEHAEEFLFPFLVEFCLVASCLLYIMWTNVGRQPKNHKRVVKPSYKFYKSYTGTALGACVLIVTVIILVVLGTLDSNLPASEQDYMSESDYLEMYDLFLIIFNLSCMIGCIFGFYVFHNNLHREKVESSLNLDVVLLVICLIGPLLLDLFSILAMTAGHPSTKASSWALSLLYPITDILVNICQVLFIVYGLGREPLVDDENDMIRQSVTSPGHENHDLVMTPLTAKTLSGQQATCLSITDSKAGTPQSVDKKVFNFDVHAPVGGSYDPKRVQLMRQESTKLLVSPDSVIYTPNRRDDEILQSITIQDGNTERIFSPMMMQNNQHHNDKFNPKRMISKLAHPDRPRILLRDSLIFLMISNACLWVFLSLDGTAFSVYTYQYEYFGHTAWSTLTFVTAPLAIFLRMHLAACFFEIWSYA